MQRQAKSTPQCTQQHECSCDPLRDQSQIQSACDALHDRPQLKMDWPTCSTIRIRPRVSKTFARLHDNMQSASRRAPFMHEIYHNLNNPNLKNKYSILPDSVDFARVLARHCGFCVELTAKSTTYSVKVLAKSAKSAEHPGGISENLRKSW